MLCHKSWRVVAADSSSYSFEFLISQFVAAHPDLSSPIQLHPASQNSAWRFLALPPARSNLAMSNGRQLPDDFFPGAEFLPMLQCRAHSHGRDLPEGHGHSGGSVLLIVLRILLGSTSNLLLDYSNRTLPLTQRESLVARVAAVQVLTLRRRAESHTRPIPNPTSLAFPAQRNEESLVK